MTKYDNNLLLSCPPAMNNRLLGRALCLLVLLCTISPFSTANNHLDPSSPEQGVTFSHVYKIDIPGGSSCKLERLPTEDETGLKQISTEENALKCIHNNKHIVLFCVSD